MKTYFPVAIALLVGAAIGYCLAPTSPAPVADAQGAEQAEETKAPAEDEGDKSSVRALRARVKELEDMLAEQGVEVERMKEEEAERGRRSERRHDPRAEMERIKKEDPARYSQMTNAMALFRRHRLERAQRKMDILGSVDTSRMSDSARQTHEALQDAIERREALEDKMRNWMDMSDEERGAVFAEMRDTSRKIAELGAAERDNLLVQTAEELGFAGDDAADIVETVKAIYEATETEHVFGPAGHGGRGPRRGRGGGGR